ncbi:flagellar biosynthetic protein FliR [Paenarthrobacter sp. DKR-5]|uniref:flagellar biosynthetic protein FliR n=1 Tax=Paenarthrobacter sp. DKR-5 TaxID=2835535 RepID=UPI001BDC083E|nr:flagellar biosynthetic protein FliR [Paenarthrobacter sp. DKR-5]MBT1002813.1 flagellar biosynthetic protein FliR [Paenarthrobacter sp. DKR-5]
MNIPLDQAWLEAVMLAGVRMVAFLVIAPPFSHNAIPLQIKGILGVGLALAVSPVVTHGYKSQDLGGFVLSLILEIVAGAALGFLVYLVFAAVQSAGSLIDLFGGFQMAQAFDPQGMINGAQFTRLFQMTALVLLFASDGYQLVLGGLTRTFTALPLGGGLDLTVPAHTMVSAVTGMFLASIQIAGPLLVVLFLADVGLGLLTRVAPALNAFQLGFPLKIMLTLALGGIAFTALPRVVASLAEQAGALLTGVR